MEIAKFEHGFVVLEESSNRDNFFKATIHYAPMKPSQIIELLEKFNESKEIFVDVEIDENKNIISTQFIGTNNIKTKEAIGELRNIDVMIYKKNKPKETYRDNFNKK